MEPANVVSISVIDTCRTKPGKLDRSLHTVRCAALEKPEGNQSVIVTELR